MRTALLAALACASLAGCDRAPPAAAPDDAAADGQAVREEVLGVVNRTVAGFNAKDADTALAMFAPDLVSMYHGLPNANLAQERKTTAMQVADPALELRVSGEDVDVAEAGDMAVYTARYRFAFTDSETGQPGSEIGNWVLVFDRQGDGSMKVSKAVVSDLPADGSAEDAGG